MRRLALALAVLLFAGTAGAVETVLTPESVLFAIEQSGPQARLEIVKRADTGREALVVPGTEDDALESEARLAFDQQDNILYVMWRQAGQNDRILLASYDATGTWSEPRVVAEGPQQHVGLNLVVTRVSYMTFVHAAWWNIDADGGVAKYALIAYDHGTHVSTEVEDLDMLANVSQTDDLELDDQSEAIHPPLSMAKSEYGVDVVFGKTGTTALTRVVLSPKLQTLARIWKPVGKEGGHLPSARLYSSSTDPVRSFISKGRVVLYTPDAQFRFVVFENGRWSPTRSIQLDESLSADAVLYELRKTIDAQSEAEDDIVTH